MVAGREGVDVETLADARLARVSHEPRLRGAEILHGRHLEVGRIALEDIGRRARPFGDRDVVGEIADARGSRAPMRLEDQREAERLRRLHRAQARAGRGGEHPALAVDLLDRVAEPRSRRRRAMACRRLNRPRDELRASGTAARRRE